MPPKAASADAETSALVVSARAAQEKMLSGLQQFLETNRPPLSANEYEALIPRYNGGPHWTAQDEASLQADDRFAYIFWEGQGLWNKNKGARQLWRLFPLVYRCLPTDLFSWAYQVDADTSKNFPIAGGPYDGKRNVVWSKNFCTLVTAFTMHGFWTYNREWDLPVMAQLMQLAVICRTNDCRRWQLVNHTEDTFFTELAIELQSHAAGVRTIKDIMDAIDARMNARNRRPSQFRLICRDVVTELFRPAAGPLVHGAPGPYKVTADDLKALVKVLDRAGPSPDRTGLTNGWSADAWRGAMETARGRPGRYTARPQPTEDSDLLARAIAFGFMARERDEKIAERVVQAQVQAQAAAQAAAQGLAQVQGSAAPAAQNFGQEDDGMDSFAVDDEQTQAELELVQRAEADKEAAEKWIAETMVRNTIGRNRPPSPSQGRINRDPPYRASKEYPPGFFEE